MGCNELDGLMTPWAVFVAAGRAQPAVMWCWRGGDLEYGPRIAPVGSVFYET